VIVFAVRINGREQLRWPDLAREAVVRRSVWFWLLVAVLIVVLLGLLFGGYRKGAKVGLPDPAPLTGYSNNSSYSLS
jgi:hypothetical protein